MCDDRASPLERLPATFAGYTGHAMDIDMAVFESERETGHRNRAIAHLLRGHGILEGSPEAATDLYFQQCAIRARGVLAAAGRQGQQRAR
ncbi:glutaminase, partial [Thiohalocapsa halophila]